MKRLLLCLGMVVIAMTTYAQRTISGIVSDDSGDGLIGASVLAEGTDVGTTTDFDGSYSLEVPEGTANLIFSYIGYQEEVVALGASDIIDITLREGVALEEVVVTALGIKREKKTLGYASTTVTSELLAEKPETDVGRLLAGKSPGVNIASASGIAGSGTKINIRGTSTVSGNSQPLWVVDGIPINTAANENNDFRDGNVTPTRNLDIDPNNIASMSVLRGLAATNAYGSQGRNGVILITTKTGSSEAGKERFFANVSQSFNAVTAHIPEYQNSWANGFDGNYGEFFSNWGSLFSNNTEVPRHPYFEHRNTFPDRPEFGQPYTPVAAPNNVEDFFETGTSTTTSLTAGVSGQKSAFNVAVSRLDESGYIKNNNLDRTNVSIGGMAKVGEKLKLSGNFNVIQTNFETPPVGAGQGSRAIGGPSVFATLFYTPRNIDLMNLPYEHPVTRASVYYRNGNDIVNPRWLLEHAGQTSTTNRFMTMMNANYAVTDWMSVNYRFGLDHYNESQSYHVNRGAVGFPGSAAVFGTGLLRTTEGSNSIYDHNIVLSGQRNLSDDIDFSFNAGFNHREDRYEQVGLESTNQVVFGLLNHRNFAQSNSRDFRNNNLSFERTQIIQGFYGDLTFGYRNYLYLTAAARNDWASSHEQEFRSQFYPSVNMSFIPSDAFDLSNTPISFLKLRAGYGTSANFSSPYRTRPFLSLNSQITEDANGNVISLALPRSLANPNLKPELQTELEFGGEVKLFTNRIGIDVSYYDRLAEDQIIRRQLDPASGYDNTFINAGAISNKGWEIGLSLTPVSNKNVVWNVRANYTRNRSLVESLPDGTDEILLSGFTNLGSFAVEGEPFGVIKGTYVVRDGADGRTGNLTTNNNGDWVISNNTDIIGDPNPNYMLSTFTDVTVFGITLAAQLDYVDGGQIFSYSAATPTGRGVAEELESFNPEVTVVLPGVNQETGEPNDRPIAASSLFFGNNILGGGADDRGIYDASTVRLREVSLSYSVPKKLLSKTSVVKSINISLVANNVWYRAVNTPKSAKVDPERTAFGTGNGIGFDFLGGPSAARYGATVRFGF